MQDRIPRKPGRVLVTPENGGEAFYATLSRADDPEQEGTPLNKNALLRDETAALLGLGADAVPDDVFARLAQSGENLLNNWYFADPIDQRGGYVVPPGVPLYRDAELQTPVGSNSESWHKVKTITDSYVEFWNVAETSTFFATPDAAVRGYKGAGYTIDRWKITGASSILKIVNGGITFTPTAASNGVRQDVESAESFAGKKVTVSFLLGTANGTKARAGFGDGSNHFGEWSTSEIITYTGVVANDATTLTAFIQLDTVAESPLIIAAKLELGSTQTLAHKEGDTWVLNDPPPNKQMETLKCCMSKADPYDTYANGNNYTSLGMTKIATGSYVGTGVWGESNKTEIALDFTPKLAFVYNISESNTETENEYRSSYFYSTRNRAVAFVNGPKKDSIFRTYHSGDQFTGVDWYRNYEWGENFLRIFSSYSGNDYDVQEGSGAEAQLNKVGNVYGYVIAG